MYKRMTSPLAVKPPVYELSINLWNWCKLTEVCALVPDLARAARIDFTPTPEELVSRFAGLVRLNRIRNNVPLDKREERKKKIFRFSADGNGFSGTNVPIAGLEIPPYVPFQLSIETPYPETLFVTEEWAIDTLYAIRRGAVAAMVCDGFHIGFPPRSSGRDLIHLGGQLGSYIVKIPEYA